MAGAQASIVSTTIIRPGRVRLVRGEGFSGLALKACFAKISPPGRFSLRA